MPESLRHGLAAAGERAQRRSEPQRELEPGLARYREWLRSTLPAPDEVIVIDSHTGLGPCGRETLFAEHGDPAAINALRAAIGQPIHTPHDAGFVYRARGNVAHLVAGCFPAARVSCLTEEFGTEKPLAVLRALREEHRWHRRGATEPAHPARQRLKDVFAPPAPTWRQQTVSQGVRLVRRVLAIAGRVAMRQP